MDFRMANLHLHVLICVRLLLWCEITYTMKNTYLIKVYLFILYLSKTMAIFVKLLVFDIHKISSLITYSATLFPYLT